MIARRPRMTLDRLKRAADSGDLFLMYQPKLDLRANRITGVEALARWQHPRRGPIYPSDFIPATERSGFISVAIGFMKPVTRTSSPFVTPPSRPPALLVGLTGPSPAASAPRAF